METKPFLIGLLFLAGLLGVESTTFAQSAPPPSGKAQLVVVGSGFYPE